MEEETTLSFEKMYDASFLVKREEDIPQIKGILDKYGAAIIHEKPGVKSKLSYPLKKQSEGFFSVLGFKATSEAIKDLSHELQLHEGVLRFLIQRVRVQAGNKNKEAVKELDIREKKKVEGTEIKKSFDTILTNEALEKKIEEILK